MEKKREHIRVSGEARIKMYRVMKLYLLFFIIGALQVSASVYSQNEKLNVEVKNIALADLLWQLQENTDLVFVYKTKDLNGAPTISLSKKDALITEILDEVLEGSNLEYELDNGVIVIKRKKIEPELMQDIQVQEKISLTGKVTDDDGAPLPGVAIIVSNSSVGTITDSNGNYVLNLPSDLRDMTIVFSFLGMKKQEIPYANQEILNVVMVDDMEGLEEVVITGLQTIKKGRATGSFSIVNEEDLTTQISSNFIERMKSLVPGVLVDENNNITMRGVNTLQGETRPLIVVDGIPVETNSRDNTFEMNPNDIESVTFLKDAASASIWGIRSSAGVVVITTKRAKGNDKFDVDVIASSTWEQAYDYSWNQYVGAGEFAQNRYDIAKYDIEVGDYYPGNSYDAAGYIAHKENEGLINGTQAAQELAYLKSINNIKTINDNYYRVGRQNDLHVSLRNGSDKFRNYTSLNVTDVNSGNVGDENTSFNILTNNDYQINDKLSFKLGFRGRYTNYTNNHVSPGTTPMDEVWNGDYVHMIGRNGVPQITQDQLGDYGFKDWTYNTLQNLHDNDNQTKVLDANINISLNYEIAKNLNFATTFVYNHQTTSANNYASEDHYESRNLVNRFSEVVGLVPVGDDFVPDFTIVNNHYPTTGGVLNKAKETRENYSWRNTLSYFLDLNDFDITLFGGSEIAERKSEYNRQTLYGVAPDLFTYSLMDFATLSEGVPGYNHYLWQVQSLNSGDNYGEAIDRDVSFFGTVNFNYKDKYDLFLSARLDRTNLLVNAKEYQNNPAWSAGFKANLMEQNCFPKEAFKYAEIKASYGLTGMIIKSSAPWMITMYQFDFETFGFPLVAQNPENLNLGWEKTYNKNIALNFGINRFDVALEYYHNNTKDILWDTDISEVIGWSTVERNSAEVVNSGVELSLGANILKGQFRWDARLNYSYNKNEIKSMNYEPPVSSAYSSLARVVGKPIDTYYSLNYGMNATGDAVIYKEDGTELSSDELALLELEDLVYEGQAQPVTHGSLYNVLTYKGWQFDFLFSYKFGHVRRFNPGDYYGGTSYTKFISQEYQWSEASQSNLVPQFDVANQESNDLFAYKQSSNTIYDADVIRLQNINLAYNFGNFKGIENIRLGVSGQNLWKWTANDLEIDPDYGLFDQARKKCIVTLNLSF